MADAGKTKAEDSAEKAYAAAAERPRADRAGSAADDAAPVVFPPKGKRGRKVTAPSAPAAMVVEAAAPKGPKLSGKPAASKPPVVMTDAKPAEMAAKVAATALPIPLPAEAITPPQVEVPVKTIEAEENTVPETPVKSQITVPETPVKSQITVPETPVKSQIKDSIMDMSATYTDGLKGVIADAQTKAQEAFSKSTAAFGEYNEFAKGNVDAMVEAGKILAAGLQDLGTTIAAESRSSFETLTADFKELTAVKSPADFFRLQSDLVRRSFDSAVAYGSKNTEAVLKLASDAAAPLSGRVSVAVDKVRQAA